MLPNLKDHKIKLVHNDEEYTQTFLTTALVYKIRTILDIKYKYSTIWRLMFSTYNNGFSYHSMLDAFKTSRGPYLIVVKGVSAIYGTYLEESLQISLRPYGSRNKFIFRIIDESVEAFKLDSVLDQIVCTDEYLSFGYNQYGYKFLIDKTLMKGEECLNEKKEFTIEYLEVYSILE